MISENAVLRQQECRLSGNVHHSTESVFRRYYTSQMKTAPDGAIFISGGACSPQRTRLRPYIPDIRQKYRELTGKPFTPTNWPYNPALSIQPIGLKIRKLVNRGVQVSLQLVNSFHLNL